MSLFSNPPYITLTPIPTDTDAVDAAVGNRDIFKMLSPAVVLGLMLAMTVLSIMLVRLCPVPSFPGTHSGGQSNASQLVQALDTLQFHKQTWDSTISKHFVSMEGGEKNGTSL